MFTLPGANIKCCRFTYKVNKKYRDTTCSGFGLRQCIRGLNFRVRVELISEPELSTMTWKSWNFLSPATYQLFWISNCGLKKTFSLSVRVAWEKANRLGTGILSHAVTACNILYSRQRAFVTCRHVTQTSTNVYLELFNVF